ncbi:cell division control protein 45 [Tremella mesenterica]|uniref:Cell division control protein 45 n=1 Tax=Tremella mesenterica TaxID=5217 RepID=A0A4Q1BB88_TREME|nr:cell division control protein 45 [Tremella mesenterica]
MPLLQPPSPDLRHGELTYTHAYNSIVSRVRRSGGSGSGGVVIFVGVDVDGLLAARILASLFKQDDVPYRLVPVGGYSELEQRRDEAFASEELHTLILLSLGSLLPLSSYFPLPNGCHLHIIDSHRPWNLQNLFGLDADFGDDGETGEQRVWVWGDGSEIELGNVKKSWEALEYEPSDSDSDSDDSDETEVDDEGSQAESSATGAKRTRAGSTGGRKRRKGDGEKVSGRLPGAVREAHYERVQRYYESGTHWGMSVAQTIYLLATVLERADNDLLWLAILGITFQYTSARIDRERYDLYHGIFMDEVARLNHEAFGGLRREPNPDDRSITRSDELRFMLFRHWNLYDAMLHSGYVAGRMGIWKEKGRKRLQGLLAKMGFSLQQCQQTWTHMDRDLKRQLPDKLDAIAPEYGLVELSYASFTRAYGFQLSSLSAADAVEGLCALLEAARGVRMEVEKEGGKGGGEWFGGTRMWNVGGGSVSRDNGRGLQDKENIDPRDNGVSNVGEEGESQEGKKEQVWHVANFWIAYDACEDINLLRKSLPLAMSLHKAIIRQGSSLLDKSTIRALRTFRFAAMKEGPDLRLFCHPSTLSRLALWLVDATRDRWSEKDSKKGQVVKSLPFVVACLNEEKGTFLVVGVTGSPEYGDVRKNKFGLAFQQAAEESGAGAKHDMFDTSVVEVRSEDLQNFIESLHLRSV